MGVERPSSEWTSRRHPVVEDIALQRRLWAMQRLGWLAMALVVALALAGLFSQGPLSRTTASGAGGRITVEAERFLRNAAATSITVGLEPEAAETTLRIGGDFADAFVVDAVQPQPSRATGTAEGLQLSFEAPADGARLVVRLAVRPDRLGIVESRFAAGDDSPAVIRHFIYP
jgi:hypothetical protein